MNTLNLGVPVCSGHPSLSTRGVGDIGQCSTEKTKAMGEEEVNCGCKKDPHRPLTFHKSSVLPIYLIFSVLHLILCSREKSDYETR